MSTVKKPLGPFGVWLQNKWFDHKDEVDRWGGTPFTDVRAYFKTYKWWLKSLYKKEQADAKRKEEQRMKHGKYS